MKLSLASLGAEPGARFLEQVKLAELLGFHAYVHQGRPTAREPLSRLGAATQVTTRLVLAAGVISPHARHAALVAQVAATLAELAPGRVRVILGAGSQIEALADDGGHSVAALRDAAGLIRRLWRGETVTRDDGVAKFALDWTPSAVPALHIAGREQQLLEFAGAVGDGVLIESFATAAGIDYAKHGILAGLQAAQRDWPDIRLCASIQLCMLEREADPIPEEIKRSVSSAIWSIRKVLGEIIDQLDPYASYEFKAFIREPPQESSVAVKDELLRLLPPGLIDSLAVVGTAAQVVERLKAVAAAGVQEVVISVVPAAGQDMIDVMYQLAQQVMPHFSERKTQTP